MREQIIFTCSECSEKNYITRKNKKTTVDKIERKKYCKHCRRHVIHKEAKVK